MKLACAFGSPWTSTGCGPCQQCQQEADRMHREFWRGVFFGEHDETGRTPAEQKARQRKGRAA